jgi:Ca-activated chloride channel family protein
MPHFRANPRSYDHVGRFWVGRKLDLKEDVMSVRFRLTTALVVVTSIVAIGSSRGAAQGAAADAQPTFRAGVDLVTIRALVRDQRGRPVTTLGVSDFELRDAGQTVEITAVEQDNGPVGLALLFDVSGSMDVSKRFGRARETGYFLLSGLRDGEDEAAIFAFDSQLHVVQPFTTDLDSLRGSISGFSPWGMTSLHDAIARASRTMDTRATRRRALVVLTDGVDTGSKLGAPEVSRIASSIDLPVYIIAVVSSIDDPRQDGRRNQALTGELSDLARWTGGRLFVAASTAEASIVAREVLDELRRQYLIAFEPGREPGWHPVEVRVRRKGHSVQARSGYFAGPPKPAS